MSRFVCLVLAAVLLGAAAAPASAAPKKSKKSPAEIGAYWTAERLRDAKPRDRARPGGGGGGGKPAADWTSFAVQAPFDLEHRKNGKLFFTIGASRYVCSATAVAASTGVNLIWTAGHCTSDAGSPVDDVLFVPGYLNGNEPYGRWAGTSVATTPGWETGEDFRYDVGAARVTKLTQNAGGAWVEDPSASLAGAVGTRTIAFQNLARGQRVVSYGYPAQGKFNGQVQRGCASTVRGTDPYNTAAPTPVVIGCDMTGGSSGGGWVRDDNASGRADAAEPLVSVNSYGYGFEKNTMYGPQMVGGQAQALYAEMD